ncbi:PilN domain-containing protein [Rhodoferax sp. BAB1]|uniref:PilN domain-containing protein n=1 Tax=Rhodoferax sp. BAB1 TaxID=2741720 RepID=UPI00157504EA|nr:PilN domain-containing protein [Rhodoferax sp. BAB1]QKO22845.1 PilN domain-containing protein [Rhodoferax sp. BAB1]
MILINLLPHREAARKKRQDVFNVSLGASALAGGLIAGIVFLWLQGQISSQEGLNTVLTQEIQKLDNQIKDIAALEAEIAALRARQQAVENLQADRNMPVHLLTELTRQFPEGVYITSMRQDNQLITLQGTAQSNERVSELLRNLAYHSPWFAKPELVEIVAANVPIGKDQRRVANFTMRVRMLRASEVQRPPEPAASAPASAASQPVKP